MLYSSFDNPLCEVHLGDCRQIIQENLSAWGQCFDFIFADSPFNIGQQYDVYYDEIGTDEFTDFMITWIGYASQCLRPGGVFAIHVPDDLVLLVLQTARAIDLSRIAWVIWHYRFGQCIESNWINSKAHCLIFRNGDDEHIFHPELVDSDRASKYNDMRTMYSATPGKRVPLDVWSVENDGPFWGRVQGNSSERVQDHPNQLPEKYLERLIRTYTNQNDLVFDPFGGTGTTAVVARALVRQCVTIDISEQYCSDISSRLEQGSIRC